MMNDGWISLWRCILEKPIWLNSTPEQKTLMITILLMVNHEPAQWEWKGEKFIIQKGQTITSINSIKNKAGQGISTQNVRSFLKRFEKLGFLTNQSTKTGRLITVINWDSYQRKKNKVTKKVTKTQQRGNKEVTPNNKDKNNNNDNKENIYAPVIEYLNKQTGAKYKSTTITTQGKIKARQNEGFTLKDFKYVIDVKTSQWLKDKKMKAYLRPETLFGTKFESYLNEKITKQQSLSKRAF